MAVVLEPTVAAYWIARSRPGDDIELAV